ncbi:hypothetical protein TIFTF001_008327 [Ficus carica]|uniref:Protein phosphatase n=1 Tax=Ficus carica TaxID=3494 RepID=A0AA88AEV6_FICCA|nr:hypothetical protein TIFTF001_008327 [Ficus carica]
MESKQKSRKVKNLVAIIISVSLLPLGEDAHFVAAEEQTVGVADGVGRWAKHGIDSGDYARQLMKNSATAVHNIKELEGSSVVDPKRILHEAFSNTTGLQGASTACIVCHNDGVLLAANVGDSGFMVFRDRKLFLQIANSAAPLQLSLPLGEPHNL